MKVIGITGGVGCGKSAVLDFMQREFGAVVVEADKVAHGLQERGTDCHYQIVKNFGIEILDHNGIIDRKKLGALCFGNPEAMALLNSIVHPAVRRELERMVREHAAAGNTKLLVLEAALLYEGGLDGLCDCVWYVYAGEERRRERLRESRGYSDEKITSMMAMQKPERYFREHCQRVIDNNSDLNATYGQIREELAWLKEG